MRKHDSKNTIEKLYKYFRNLNINDEDNSNFDVPDLDDDLANDTSIINGEITEDEVISAVKEFKNFMSPGYVHIF